MNKNRLKIILGEMNTLSEKGVISPDVFFDIQNYYSRKDETRDNKGRMLALFGILGGLLIGGGVILLLAHNWSSFGRGIQVAFFMVPLVAVQVITAVFLLGNNIRRVWFETIGIIYFLLIGAAVAMVSRIYHIAGDLETFLLVWSVGGLPVLYFLMSDSAAVLYLVLITVCAAAAREAGGSALLYWPMLAAAVPVLVSLIRRSRNRYKKALIEVLLIVSVTVSLGLTLENELTGLWILIYCSFFVLLLVSENLFKGREARLPVMGFSGMTGISVMAVLLTVGAFWEQVGFAFLADADRFYLPGPTSDYIIIGLLAAMILYLTLSRRVHLSRVNLVFCSILLPAAAGFLFSSYGALIFQTYILLLGYSLTLEEFLKEKKSYFVNMGLLIILAYLLVNLTSSEGFSVQWFFISSCFLIVVFIKSGLFSGVSAFGAARIWRSVCFVSGILVLYGLSFTRYDLPLFPEYAKISTGFILAMIISGSAAVWYLLPLIKRDKIQTVIISIFPIIVLLTFIPGLSGTLLYNLYLFGIGVAIVLKGISDRSMKTANTGIIITMTLIITRFFDVDMSFTARGGVFILIGLMFILFNVFFSRKMKKEENK